MKIDTSSYKIRVEIPNNSSIQASDYYGYYINFTNDSGKMWQAGFKNVVNSNETSVFVFDMGTSKQNNLGTWNDLVTLQDGTFTRCCPIRIFAAPASNGTRRYPSMAGMWRHVPLMEAIQP